MNTDSESVPHARIPADVSTPDTIVYGLTARQAAILAAAAAGCYLLWRTLGTLVSPPVAVAMLIPIAAGAIVLALGRRDGLPIDAWLRAGLRHHRSPARALAAAVVAPPAWAPDLPAAAGRPAPGVLRLPATAIAADGIIDLGDATAASMVAATTINIGLRTGAEQWSLLGGYARWLNTLSAPVQIVISSQPADLTGRATRISDAAAALRDPALADAACDYAAFLLEIAALREPRARTVTILATATGRTAAAEAARRGQQAASALSALGVTAAVLDGGAVTAVLTAATDPYQYGDAGHRRARPQHPITVPEGHQP